MGISSSGNGAICLTITERCECPRDKGHDLSALRKTDNNRLMKHCYIFVLHRKGTVSDWEVCSSSFPGKTCQKSPLSCWLTRQRILWSSLSHSIMGCFFDCYLFNQYKFIHPLRVRAWWCNGTLILDQHWHLILTVLENCIPLKSVNNTGYK